MTRYHPTPASGLTSRSDRRWMEQAACAGTDTEAFFIDNGRVPQIVHRICNTCPVRQACLEYAILNSELHGFWGGMAPRDRLAYAMARMTRPTINTSRSA